MRHTSLCLASSDEETAYQARVSSSYKSRLPQGPLIENGEDDHPVNHTDTVIEALLFKADFKLAS